MTSLLALVFSARERFETRLLTAEFSSTCDVARHPFRHFTTVTLHRHVNIAGWTGAWMAQKVTNVMYAVFVLLFLTVLAARMWQHQWVIFWLLKARTETFILRNFVRIVVIVTIRARPVVNSKELLDFIIELGVIEILILTNVVVVLPFLLFLVANILFQGLVQLLDPSLDAAEMERRVALMTVPNGTPLVDLVLADDALLGSRRKRLHIVNTLFCQILELSQEVLVIVLYLRLVLAVLLTLLVELNFLRSVVLMLIVIVDVVIR
jgi:hypothetical protein